MKISTTTTFIILFLLMSSIPSSLNQCPVTTYQPQIVINSITVINENFISSSRKTNLTISPSQQVKTYSYLLNKPFTKQPQIATSISDFTAEFSINLFLSVKPYIVGDGVKRLNSLNFVVRTQWKYTTWKKVKFGFVAEQRNDIEVGLFQVETNVLNSYEENKQLQLFFPYRTTFTNPPTITTFLTGFEISSKQNSTYISPLQIQQRILTRNTTGFSLSLSVTSNTLVSELVISYVIYYSRLMDKVIGSTLVYEDYLPQAAVTRNAAVSILSDLREIFHGINGFILVPKENNDIQFETSFSPGTRDFTWTSTTSILYLSYSYLALVGNKCSLCEGYPYFYLTDCLNACPAGNFSINNTCVGCPQGTNWNGSMCVKCQSTQVWNTSSLKCQCSSGSSWNGTSCVVCTGGTIFNPAKNVCECQANMMWDGSKCIACPEKSSWSDSLKSCVCTEANKLYDPKTNTCVCNVGFNLEANGSCSVKCGQNQVFNGTQCISICPVGSYYNDTSCTTFTPQCPPSTYWSGYQCISITTTCPTGTTWTGSYCISSELKCLPGYFYWNGTACNSLSQKCPYQLQWKNNMCLPTKNNCPSGSYFNGYLCIFYDQCDKNMLWNKTLSKCVCLLGSFWNGVECLKCNYGMVYSADGCVCPYGMVFNGSNCAMSSETSCKSIVNANWNGTHCVCFPGYSAIQGRCVCFGLEMSNWCNRCYQKLNSFYKNGICVCLQGFFEQNGQCVTQPQFNESTAVTPSKSNCSVGTFWKSQRKQCLPCSDGCLSCVSCYNCLQCNVGFVFNPLTELCDQICGDGKRFRLQCDDGNNLNGDGCSMDCKVEAGYICEGGSPSSGDKCTQYVPSEISFIQTGQSHLYGKIILNIRSNYLPTNLTSSLKSCRQNNCSSLLTTTITPSTLSPSVFSDYIGGAYHSISLTINFKKEPIEKFTIDISLNPQIKQKYLPSIGTGNGIKITVESMMLALVMEKDYIR